jgi:hypothetical protein
MSSFTWCVASVLQRQSAKAVWWGGRVGPGVDDLSAAVQGQYKGSTPFSSPPHKVSPESPTAAGGCLK